MPAAHSSRFLSLSTTDGQFPPRQPTNIHREKEHKKKYIVPVASSSTPCRKIRFKTSAMAHVSLLVKYALSC